MIAYQNFKVRRATSIPANVSRHGLFGGVFVTVDKRVVSLNSDPDGRFLADIVKRNVLEELSSCVHGIQQDFARDQSAVASDESGERLCGLLEAIFLHGQRPSSWALKLSSAFGVSKSSVIESTNFWPLISSVCHRDVLQKITFLRDIRTDVGRCRVVIRLALNDALFESYLLTITGNEEVVSSYYQPWAFIRDKEMVDILRGHLLGLQHFGFRLQFDKLELNRWNRYTLDLVGLIPDKASLSKITMSSLGTPLESAQEAFTQLSDHTDAPVSVIPRSKGVTVRRPRSASSPLPALPSSLENVPSPLPVIFAEPDSNVDRGDELEAILRFTLDGSAAALATDSDTSTEAGANFSQSIASRPLPIVASLIPRYANQIEEDGMDSGSNHSGSNILLKNTGWSSSYDDVDVLVPPRPRRRRGDTHESFDAVLERGVALTPGFSSSLGIGSTQFAQMVDAFQTDSSSSSTPAAPDSMMSPADFDHDFEILNPDQFFTSKSVEGKKRELLIRIPIEKGLRAQHYKCGACGRPIGMIYGKSKICNFDKIYYCLDCHSDDEAIIPSRVIHNWDFRKYRVCVKAKELIDAVEGTPLFDLKELNSKLYTNVKQIEDVKNLRIQLQIVKSYLWTCKKEICEQFNQKLWPHDHLHESIHIYSLTDLVMVHNGSLSVKMRTAIHWGIDHVRKCFLCSQRGFICEVCRSGEVLHAFDSKTNYQCSKCFAVYHKRCMNSMKPCPKCQRRFLHAQRSAEKASYEK